MCVCVCMSVYVWYMCGCVCAYVNMKTNPSIHTHACIFTKWYLHAEKLYLHTFTWTCRYHVFWLWCALISVHTYMYIPCFIIIMRFGEGCASKPRILGPYSKPVWRHVCVYVSKYVCTHTQNTHTRLYILIHTYIFVHTSNTCIECALFRSNFLFGAYIWGIACEATSRSFYNNQALDHFGIAWVFFFLSTK